MAPTATTAPTCPNCGADLGQPQGDIGVCTHCGHRSAPPGPVLDQAAQDERVARAIAEHDAARMERARREAAEREGASRENRGEKKADSAGVDYTDIVFGVVFLPIGIVCLGLLFYRLYRPDPPGPGEIVGWLVFCGYWFLDGGSSLYVGLRARRARRLAAQLDSRLRRSRLYGLATIMSCGPVKYLWGHFTSTTIELVLHVQVVGRTPWTVRTRLFEGDPRVHACSPGHEILVLVDPADPRKLVIDRHPSFRG